MVESARIAGFGPSVFSEFSRIASATGAVNLGQGFPDFDGPEEVKQAAIEAIRGGVNQYAVSTGTPLLKEAIASHAERFYGQRVDAVTGVTVTAGCTEAIVDTMLAFLDPGDQVVLFEPFYDSYQASVQLAHGLVKTVRLFPPDAGHARWWFDEQELAKAFSDKTALCLVNTPHNPTGKVFTADELQTIGALCRRYQALLVVDEVYEHLVFEPARHVRAATLPGLQDITLTLSSGGKSFSFTGWKVGWALGPAPLVAAVQKAHQWVTFCAPAPFQAAMASALKLPDTYFSAFVSDYARRSSQLRASLEAAQFSCLPTEGTYFLLADTSAHRRDSENDVAFCRRLLVEGGLASIPPSVFCSQGHAPALRHLARFAFCKSSAVLTAAAERLQAFARR